VPRWWLAPPPVARRLATWGTPTLSYCFTPRESSTHVCFTELPLFVCHGAHDVYWRLGFPTAPLESRLSCEPMKKIRGFLPKKRVTNLWNPRVDLHSGNLLFALTVEIHEWSVEEVYAALGHPRKTSMHEALQYECGISYAAT
jgi:hypothetical protein